MKIALYIGTGFLILIVLIIFGAGFESIDKDPGFATTMFAVSSTLVGILGAWWCCALTGAGLRVFVRRSVGFTLSLYPVVMLLFAFHVFSPWLSALQIGIGCSLLKSTPDFPPVRLALGFFGGAFLLLGIMAPFDLIPGGLWGGVALASAGSSLLLVRKRFTLLLTTGNFVGSFIIIGSLIIFVLTGALGSMAAIIVETLVLIFGAAFIVFPVLLERSSQFKVVGKAGSHSLDDVYQAMQDCETVLGKPWMCNLAFVGRAIMFGPNENGASIYFGKAFGHIIFGFLPTYIGIRPDAQDAWRLERKVKAQDDRAGIWAYSMELMEFNTAMVEAVRDYLMGKAFTPPPVGLDKGTLYTFNEDFRVVSQRFTMQTLNGMPRYTIEAPLPLITFTIRDAARDEEVLVVKKRFLRMREQYDFFWKGEMYGTFAKQLDLIDDIFTMSTPDGLMTMHQIQGTLGANYTVRMGETLIGIIACKLNFRLINMLFDNYLIQVRDEKYAPLMAALGAMSAREQARDRAEMVRSWRR